MALTRAAKQLVVIRDENEKLMPLVSMDDLYKTAEIFNLTGKQAKWHVIRSHSINPFRAKCF